jgi:hypothetical protein
MTTTTAAPAPATRGRAGHRADETARLLAALIDLPRPLPHGGRACSALCEPTCCAPPGDEAAWAGC